MKINFGMIRKLSMRLPIACVIFICQTFYGQNYTIIGTSSAYNTSTTYPAPYGQYYYGSKHQFLVSATELSAAGISAGASITSIGFNVFQDNSTPSTLYNNFQIKIYNVGSLTNPLQNNFTSTSLVSTSSTTNYNPGIGWNQHPVTSFIWNGSSNLVIETCFNNSSYTENAQTWLSNNLLGTNIKSRYQREDVSGVCSSTSLTQYTSTTTRPIIRFGWSQVSTGFCQPSSAFCDEYISNVTLNTLNSSSSCTSGGYANYTAISTTLVKGNQYTATVTPAVVGSTSSAYTNDEIAVWIDFNNDQTFSISEQVGYVMVPTGSWSNQFSFIVPTSAYTGNVRMRVRISYFPNDGTINPCSNSTYGETEDYTLNLVSNQNPPPSPSSISSTNNNICSGQSVTLTASGSNGITYWFAGNCGNSVGAAIGSGSSLIVNPNSSTTYYARNYSNGLWSNNCASLLISVISSATPSAPYTNSNPGCNSVTIFRNNPPVGETWYWQGTNSNGTSTLLGSGLTYLANSTGTYYLRSLNAQGCWSALSSSINVTVNPSPTTPPNPSITSSQCNSATLTRNGNPATGITWYWQGTTLNGTSTTLGSGVSFTANSSGTYYLRAYKNGCWSSNSGSVTVSLSVPPTPNTPASNSPQCSSVTINQSGNPPAGTNWYWQGTNSNGTSMLNNSSSINVTTSGTYYLRAVNTAGCWSNASALIIVNIAGYPNTPPPITSNSPHCENVTITRNGTPPSNDIWYWQGTNPNGTSSNLGSGPSYLATNSGTYYLRAYRPPSCWSPGIAGTNVHVLNSSNSNLVINACDSYTSPSGTTYTNSGQYQSVIANTVGCDSNIQIQLNIHPSYNYISSILACENYTWTNGVTYYSNNNSATQFLTSSHGCDSIVHLNLQIGQPQMDTTLVQVSAVNTFEYYGVEYNQTGEYYQTLNDQYGCDSVVFLQLFIESLSDAPIEKTEIKIYPNPSVDGLFYFTAEHVEILNLKDIFGKIIRENILENTIDLRMLNSGTYFLTIKFNGQVSTLKLIYL